MFTATPVVRLSILTFLLKDLSTISGLLLPSAHANETAILESRKLLYCICSQLTVALGNHADRGRDSFSNVKVMIVGIFHVVRSR